MTGHRRVPASLHDWKDRAECSSGHKGYGVADFHAETNPAQVAAAKSVCAVCPVRSECLAWAMHLRMDDDGIYGGMTPDERRKLRERLEKRRLRRSA